MCQYEVISLYPPMNIWGTCDVAKHRSSIHIWSELCFSGLTLQRHLLLQNPDARILCSWAIFHIACDLVERFDTRSPRNRVISISS